MNPLPILAAAAPVSSPSPGSLGRAASTGNPAFLAVLQQLSPGASPTAANPLTTEFSDVPADIAAHEQALSQSNILSMASQDANEENARAGTGAKSGILLDSKSNTHKSVAKGKAKPAAAKTAPDKAISTDSKSVIVSVATPTPAKAGLPCDSVNSLVTAQKFSGDPSTSVTPHGEASRLTGTAANAAETSVVPQPPVATVATPNDTSAPASSLAKEFSDPSVGVSSTGAAMVHAFTAARAATKLFDLTTRSTDSSAGRKARPQSVASSDETTGTADSTSHATANTHALFSRENLADGSSPLNDPALRSSTESPARSAKAHSRHEAVPQGDVPSAVRESNSGAASADDHDLGASLASGVNVHASSFQPGTLQPADSPLPAATAQVVTSAPVFTAPHAQGSAPASTQAPQLQSSSAPDLPRMVDSGQLRVHENSSELKISVQLPELGKIEVRAVSAREVTTAHLTTSQHDALQVLTADRTTLEQALKSRDVILGSLSSHSQSDTGGGQHQPGSSPPAPPSRDTPPAAAAAINPEESYTTGFLPDYSSISVRA